MPSPEMAPLARLLILVGLILLIAGAAIHLLPQLPWLGRLPGDVRIERPGLRIYIPLASSILLSLLLTLALVLWTRWRG